MVVYRRSGENLRKKFKQQRAFVRWVGGIGQQGECSYIDRLDTLVEETLAHTFIVTASGKQYVAADDFLGCMSEAVGTVIDGITVAVHLIYCVSRRCVGTSARIVFLAIFSVELVIIEQSILSIEKIGQLESIGLDNGKHDVGTILGGCRMHFACLAAVCVLIMQTDV